MIRRYIIDAERIDAAAALSPESIYLDGKDKIEKRFSTSEQAEIFGTPEENRIFWTHLRSEFRKFTAPLRSPQGLSNFGIISVLLLIASFPLLFFLRYFREPLSRGWRLEIVRRVGLEHNVQVPGARPDLLFRYLWKGLVLIFMRTLYFLPLIIMGLFSSGKYFDLAIEFVKYLWEKANDLDNAGIMEFIFKKVLVEAWIDVIIQLLVLSLYVVFIWPVYRLIMVQYALGLTNAFGFLNPAVIKKSIGIFRRNPAMVYGIYAFSVALDCLAFFSGFILPILTLGLYYLIKPVFSLLIKHWGKGYAYGMLARQLIAINELQPKNAVQRSSTPTEDELV